ncbi:hypothetical protein AGMMS49965_06040 [Bacteroidia bacterium]|nr:hypothetical protein AGMMS49965_06040 [Bacteroidia bacterium]
MKKNNKKTFDKSFWLSVSIFLLIVIIILFLPALITGNYWLGIDFTHTGEIGDTIGGIISPFVAIAAAVLTFIAFWVQFKANQQQREDIALERFDNQFFEMLKIHKENSNNIIKSYAESVAGSGFGCGEGKMQLAPLLELQEHRKRGFEYFVEEINKEYDEWKKMNKKSEKKDIFLSVYSSQWKKAGYSFGHYFRHLFLIVKFVVSKDFLTYEERRNYLRILRASLSTYEQVFLYYNWLSGYGRKWEDDNNHYFTDYRMIHNVDFSIHKDFQINNMQPFKELLEKKNYRTEKNRDVNDDTLFELIK